MVDLKDYAPFTGLLIFGNIENLILASQGAVLVVENGLKVSSPDYATDTVFDPMT